MVFRPRQFGSSWLSPSPIWSPKTVSPAVPTVQGLMRRAVIGVADSFVEVARDLPPQMLLSLIYRVTVLHLAARIVPVIRKSSIGWDDGMEPNGAGDVAPGFWDGRSLRQEPAVRGSCQASPSTRWCNAKIMQNMRITTVVLSYRRAILITVYTHLLRESSLCITAIR